MQFVYMYINGENPLKYFYRNDCKPSSDFCFFSSKEEALKHYFKDNVEDYYPETNESVEWFAPILNLVESGKIEDCLNNLKTITEFYERSGGDEDSTIIQIPIDAKFNVHGDVITDK